MPDTIEIKHYYRTLACDDFQRHWKKLSYRRNPTWVFNGDGSEVQPNLTIINTPDGIWHQSARGSLPKLINGHNARLPNQTETIQAVQKMADFAQTVSGNPFDVETATVSLIHYAQDIWLGEPGVWKTIEKLAKKKIPGLRKLFVDDATIYFTSKGRSSQFRIYSKLFDVLKKQPTEEAIEAARGNLRFEYCLLKRDSIKAFAKRLSLTDRTTQSFLREDVSDFAISELLDKLNFFDLLPDGKTNLEILKEYFSTRKAMNLCGFLQMVAEYGEQFYKDKSHGFKKDAYYRSRRDCLKAKVW